MKDRTLNYGRHIIERFLKSVAPYHSVLDVGAGHGVDLLAAKKIVPAANIFAIEDKLEYQRDLIEHGIIVHQLNIEKDVFPFPDESLDVVIVNQVLEHIKEIFWVFHEITRVLKIGGKVIIGVPNLASFHNRILLSLGRQPSCIQIASAHIRGFTKRALLAFLCKGFPAGYDLISFGGGNFYPFQKNIAKYLASLFPTMSVCIFFMIEKHRKYNREFIDYPSQQSLESNFYIGTPGLLGNRAV